MQFFIFLLRNIHLFTDQGLVISEAADHILGKDKGHCQCIFIDLMIGISLDGGYRQIFQTFMIEKETVLLNRRITQVFQKIWWKPVIREYSRIFFLFFILR